MKSHISKEKFSMPSGLTEETLRNEHNFLNYVRMLKSFAKKYCVIITAYDTPCGPAYTQAISKEVMDIGLKVDLYNKFRCPYIAVIDEGVVLFEKLELNQKSILEVQVKLDTKDKVEVISKCWSAPGALMSSIKINGTEYFPNSRGLNFVVYDKFSKTVIDSVGFDTYSDLIYTRPREVYNILEKFMQTHPGVTVVEFNLPRFPSSGWTEHEKFIQSNNAGFGFIQRNPKSSVLSQFYDDKGVLEVLSTPRSYIDNIGTRRLEETHGKHINISGGHRVTCHQPLQDGKNINIYIYGPCIVFGVGASDEHTIASHLQKILNESAPQYKAIVHNYGFFLEGSSGMTLEQTSVLFNSFPIKPGDIVLYCNGFFSGGQIPNIDMLDAACEPRDYEVFIDLGGHLAPDGMKLVAEKLYKGLMEQDILDKARELASERGNAESTVANNSDFDKNTNEQLAEYKRFLTDFYNSSLRQTIGAVVMNCNPFTLGHRYLIDKALEQCSFLILFLVEEDKSEFSFDERLKLVDEGTKDIPNLAIIPSGRFVLSSLTFSEYFNKSEMQDRIIDTSLDVNVFAREIAPCLNITKRFAGEEPLDNVTKQYNESMRRILPEYGIEFVEIPRVELDSKPISASRVRELAKNGRFSELQKLVPQTTLDYLVAKYK